MLRVLPFVVFFALRALAHATVPDPFAIRAACHDIEVHRALVRVLDAAATGVERAQRLLVSRLPESLDQGPLPGRTSPARATSTVSVPVPSPSPDPEPTPPSGSRAPPWRAGTLGSSPPSRYLPSAPPSRVS